MQATRVVLLFAALPVLGPSGCGKTTLLSAIAGVIDPDAGTITLNGTNLSGRAPENRRTMLVFQNGALFPHMTTRKNISYAAESTERVEELAKSLEITDILNQQADTLSGGERQRVALARSLATDPVALLLDEPLANLGAPIKRRLRDEIRPLLSSLDIPVVYVTHDQREAHIVARCIRKEEDHSYAELVDRLGLIPGICDRLDLHPDALPDLTAFYYSLDRT